MDIGEPSSVILAGAALLVPVILIGIWIREVRAGKSYSSLGPDERRTEFKRGMARNTWRDLVRLLLGLSIFCLAVEVLVYLVPGVPMLRYVVYLYGWLIVVLLSVRRNRVAKN